MKRSGFPSRLRGFAVFVCAFVVLFATTAEAVHYHDGAKLTNPGTKKSNETCVVCHAAHNPSVSPAHAPVFEQIREDLLVVPVLAERVSQLSFFELYLRPPPELA